MTTKRWSSFPDFDVNAWERQLPHSAEAVHPFEGWRKPLWTAHSVIRELPERGVSPRTEGNPWMLTQTLSHKSQVMPALMGGVEGLRFAEGSANDGWLEGVHLDMISVELNSEEVRNGAFAQGHWTSTEWQGACGLDCNSMTSLSAAEHMLLWANHQKLRRWLLDGGSEANRVNRAVKALQQLDRTHELFRSMDMDVSAEWGAFQWKWQSGVHVLEEVAFLRAIRFVWERWLEVNDHALVPIWIDAQTSHDFMVETQPTDHLIGLTAASYAAAIGGADSIETLSHDHAQESASHDGLRWARNIQHLMREESHLDKTFDPMGGSRVIEAWTHSIVDAIWATYTRSKPTDQ